LLFILQIEGIVRFYLEIRGEALHSLADGTGRQPHFSLRTLCRALVVAASNPCGTVARSLYEAFCLSFLTQLDRSSHPIVEKLVVRHVVGNKNMKSVMGQALTQPKPLWKGQTESIQVEGYWIPKGDLEPHEAKNYILTDSVRCNMKDLVRVVSLGRLPVLLQGETSVGKTSLIGYLAQLTGNKCVRVNNHEHTDLQEYVGSYTADPTTGKLIFREGVLVDAMRQGYWLILDELNLAPSEVLEALNRLLDDNRELFIAETQETIKAHPRFLLFATQNPPGGNYGGRKLLSRAFRNRFVELHFNDIPPQELETILHRRCDMPPSYCKRCVAVMGELQLRRRGSAAFAGKQGFMTLRDLFRWAERYRLAITDSAATFYDWDQHLADEGYLVLAGRVRKDEEALVIREVLGKHFKRTVDPQRLFTLSNETSPVTRPILESLQQLEGFDHLVWTFALRRLAVLVGQSLRFVEPVLLVGDTGCGKTSVCQYLASQKNCQLMTINCHQYSEGSDFLGGLRPVRNLQDQQSESGVVDRLFEWVDGPLVLSMIGGHYFLADEISLADDSVLERLNSVLEPERSLLLSEKAGSGEPEVIKAADRFRFLATMNPGGDYGKKELSPALRNRLTEIWCPMSRDRQDIIDIADHNLKRKSITTVDGQNLSIAICIVDFVEWFSKSETGRKSTVSIRDILSWVQFINAVTQLDPASAYVHGACLVFLDSLGNRAVVEEAIRRLAAPVSTQVNIAALMGRSVSGSTVKLQEGLFGIDPFFIETGPKPTSQSSFTFNAPSTSANLVRLLRALQLKKPLLLEGSPGVGKTSLVAALAEATGHELVRINLSEQTDVSDLFGADLPVEGSETGGRFEWRDGPLLRALKEGQWIVLDELNLASQSVLEGLNAVLDHRGELYIPELGRSFRVQPQMTKLFACQNPLKQGGARKGLPRSFLNRFTQVYVDPLSKDDLQFIARSVYPEIDPAVIVKMVEFNEQLVKEVTQSGQWGLRGGPWEFNLRDVFRWCEAVQCSKSSNPGQFVGLIYADRMRSLQDRETMLYTYERVFGPEYPVPRGQDLHVYLTESWIQVGSAVLPRGSHHGDLIDGHELLILQRNLRPLESMMHCIALNWMTILVRRTLFISLMGVVIN
jgi:midasin